MEVSSWFLESLTDEEVRAIEQRENSPGIVKRMLTEMNSKK